MKNIVVLLIIFLWLSFGLQQNVFGGTVDFTNIFNIKPTDFQDEYADFYLVIAASGKDYKKLHKTMVSVNQNFAIPINTLGRYYNEKSHKIIVNEDDEDEIYRGEYYPRRFEELSLSIENAYYYNDNYMEPKQFPTTMMVVAGMFNEKTKADSLRNILLKKIPDAYIKKARIYVGCMH